MRLRRCNAIRTRRRSTIYTSLFLTDRAILRKMYRN